MKENRLSLISKVKEKMDKSESIEQKLFWVVCPISLCAGIVSAIATALEDLGTIQTVFACLCAATPILLMVYCAFSKKYSLCYSLLCIFLGGILMPITFLTNGGLHSGMPLYCLGTTNLSFYCIRSKDRYGTFAVTLVMTMLSFLVAHFFPERVYAIDPDFVETDIILSYFLVVVALFVFNNVVISEFKFYTKTSNVLSHFMDDNIRKLLLESESYEDLVNRPGQKGRVAVLFADVSNFSTYSEMMSPEETVEFLNIFLTIAEESIHKNGGTLDKYIGDCVMAFWIDTNNDGDGVYQACQTIMDIQESLYKISDVVYERFKNELTFGAGINYGEAIVGGIGSKNRKDFTITGDVVNIASKLQSMAPRGTYYLSESAAKIMEDKADVVKVRQQVFVKGKTKSLDVYTLRSLGKKEEIKKGKINIYNTNTGYQLHICGCRGSYSVAGFRYTEYGGETSCYVIRKGTHAVVVDCGSGLYNARAILKDCKTIDVLLTHVHYDHIMGLLDYSVFPKDCELKLYSTFDKWHNDDTVHHLLRAPYWPVDLSRGQMINVTQELPFNITPDIEVTFYKATHPNFSSLIVLNIMGRKICVMADCENSHDLPDYEVRGADIILFDGMYEDENYESHRGWGHSTWQAGVRLADEVNAGRLIITHHNPQSNDAKLRELETRAKEMCSNVSFAREGEIYLI